MSHKEIKFDKKELQAFTLLYIANADLEIDTEEMEFIRDFLGEDKFKRVFKVFKKSNDTECLDIILEHRNEFFKDEADKELLLWEISELIRMDNKISKMEEAAVRGLRRLLK